MGPASVAGLLLSPGAGAGRDQPALVAVDEAVAGRGLVDGAPAAYVCRHFTCQAPVTTPQQLREVLAAPS